MILRVSLGLGLFVGSLALGWWLKSCGVMTEPRASWLVRFLVRGPSPVVLCLIFWRMDLSHREPWLLPLLGVLIAASTLPPAFWYATRARLTGPETGSFLTAAFFSNLGYLGAFTAFALFGEAAYGLCVLYFMFFTPCFYTLGFWIGRSFGGVKRAGEDGKTLTDDLRFVPFLGMLVGVVLNLARVPRPGIFEWVNHVLIPLDTALYLIAIGSQLTLESPRPLLRHCLMMSGLKFLYTPLIAWGLVQLIGLEGLPRLIVLLEASTPVAVSPLVLPLLFGLDRRMAHALWWVTTLLAIPWLFVLLPLLPRL